MEFLKCTHTLEYYSAIKRQEILPFETTYMNMLLGETGKAQKDTYCMMSLTCGIY
jgi:hypothetical protein